MFTGNFQDALAQASGINAEVTAAMQQAAGAAFVNAMDLLLKGSLALATALVVVAAFGLAKKSHADIGASIRRTVCNACQTAMDVLWQAYLATGAAMALASAYFPVQTLQDGEEANTLARGFDDGANETPRMRIGGAAG